MKIVFVSNYINHHQIPFCEALIKKLGPAGDFAFIQTEEIEEERTSMGWKDEKLPYVLRSYESKEAHEACLKKILDADCALIGWTTDMSLIMPRLKKGALTLRISERLYKKSQLYAYNPRGLIAKYKEHTAFRKGPVYLMCAGAYVASDYGIFGAYPGKKFKWGYFPELKEYGNEDPLSFKSNPGEPVKILWAGRFIDWKHAENALLVAGKLKSVGIPFHMNIIGTGEMEEELKQISAEKRLIENVTFTGPMAPDKVREYMEKADIFISTSDRQEGWGAVINEAMNSSCCMIVPAEAGAVPYMIENGYNGYVFRSDDTDELVSCCMQAARYPDIRKKMGSRAYETVRYTWNAQVAAERIIELIGILSDAWGIADDECGKPSRDFPLETIIPWTDGPCSREEVRDESVVTEESLKFKKPDQDY